MAYSTITKPADYFNTILWTGNGVDDRSITGVGFQPDWIWLKQRNGTNYPTSFDSVRGATKRIFSNVTDAEDTNADSLQAFESDGFQVGTNGGVNGNTNTYVAWNWLAGGTVSSNTDGSITSSVLANTTSGFSIVSYTGTGSNATVGHGLGTTPACIISKNRNDIDNWNFWHQNLSATSGKYMTFNDTGAEQTDSTIWNTAPTSTVFGIGTNNRINGSGDGMIAYCFAEKKGFSKFGKFSGTTGEEFVYTGFKPAFVILKRTNTTSDWYIFDNKRNPFNLSTKALDGNTADAEATYASGLDLLSNGFVDKSFLADNGNELIYMAFAENPLVANTGGGIPATAR